MSKTFTINDLNEAYETLKNAYSCHTFDTHREIDNIVDLAASNNITRLVRIAQDGDTFEVLNIIEIKTDCKYYSGEHLLFCAVNTKCCNCVDYCPEG